MYKSEIILKNIKNNLELFRESESIKKQEFADCLEVSPSSYSDVLMERTNPTLKMIIGLLNAYPTLLPYNLSWVTRGFYTALKKAGLHKHSAAHLIRHTFGRRVIESNQSDFDKGQRLAQELLRHKESGMTRHYTKIVKDYLIEEHSKLDL